MYRIDWVLTVLALLPLVMAGLVRGFIVTKRKKKMQAALSGAQDTAGMPHCGDATDQKASASIEVGKAQMAMDFDSLFGIRFFFPALLLSFLYLMAFSLGISCIAGNGPCAGFLCWKFECFKPEYLYNPLFAAVGAYTFHTGVIVRRSFMTDITKNVYWSSVNRLLFSVAFALVLYLMPFDAGKKPEMRIVCFAVAFFPGVAITWLRKYLRKALQIEDPDLPELEIQLIQGIDIWKEDRLVEEGIEGVENLATANVFSLAAKMHYPMRTIVDWMDQAILIQRFPNQVKQIQAAGLPMSAIEFAWMGKRDQTMETATLVAGKMGLEPLIVKIAMDAFCEDVVINVLWRLWQTPDTE